MLDAHIHTHTRYYMITHLSGGTRNATYSPMSTCETRLPETAFLIPIRSPSFHLRMNAHVQQNLQRVLAEQMDASSPKLEDKLVQDPHRSKHKQRPHPLLSFSLQPKLQICNNNARTQRVLVSRTYTRERFVFQAFPYEIRARSGRYLSLCRLFAILHDSRDVSAPGANPDFDEKKHAEASKRNKRRDWPARAVFGLLRAESVPDRNRTAAGVQFSSAAGSFCCCALQCSRCSD